MCVFETSPHQVGVRLAGGVEGGARVVAIGSTRMGKKVEMFWNFVARDRAKIEVAKVAWPNMGRSVFPPVVNEDNLDSIPIPK